MDRENLIASEFGYEMDPDVPIYKFQQRSEAAQARRDRRIEAAEKGQVFIG